MRTSTFTRAARKFLAVSMAAALALGLMPAFGAGIGDASLTASAAERDESAQQLPTGSASTDTQGADDAAAPEASAQSASTHAASSGSAGGTTVKIEVYRSSFPIAKWDLNDNDNALTKAVWAWADRTSELPQDANPGAAIEWDAPADYSEPTRAGFEFAGWSTSKSVSSGGFLNAEPAITMPEGVPEGGNYTLYALWTPIEYSVVFELAKNPDPKAGARDPGEAAADDEESYDLNWDTKDGVRTVTYLGEGRYRVNGFTMAGDDYDPITRTVTLPEPARTGYRFLGWAQAAGASSLVVDGPDGTFALNPVRLPQIDGAPVLTARWTSAFGVTAPLSITFGGYDKTGAPGNPSLGEELVTAGDDSSQSQQDEVGVDFAQGYAQGGDAYFENTGWNDPIKMVALTSKRDDNANAVLTTYDSSKATEAAVLGDGTVTNPGERLLSLYPRDSGKSTGVHFRLTDNLLEEDLTAMPSLKPSDSGTDNKLYVTYGLNLSEDPVTGLDNHGLVLDKNNDYERMPIATVVYTFATGETATEEPGPSIYPTGSTADALYVTVDNSFLENNGLASKFMSGTYGLADIKKAADHLSAQGSASIYYEFYEALLNAQVMRDGTPSAAPYFKCKVNGVDWDMQLLGICQDTKTAGGKAGLTFQMRDFFSYSNIIRYPGNGAEYVSTMNTSNTNAGGWASSNQRSLLRTTFLSYLDSALQASITPVNKYQQLQGGATADSLQSTTDESVWLPSMYEVYGTTVSAYNVAEGLTDVPGYKPFQYMALQGNGGTATNVYAKKRYRTGASGSGTLGIMWLRSARGGNATDFCLVGNGGTYTGTCTASKDYGIAPCFCL